MGEQYVNLNETGVLSQSGARYESTADDSQGEAQSFRGRMEASQHGLRGGAGRVFTGVTDQHAGNLTLLAQQIAEQAVRAVRAEREIVGADEESVRTQQGLVSAVDDQARAISRPINAEA
jgi:hypothetical protein